MEYNFTEVEKKWREYWADNKTFRAENNSSKPKYYVLDMFPYPSGAGLHVGHPLGYIASDIVARYKRIQGYNVLHPMGYDSFGLPAEQYAIQTGTHPAITTEQNINRYREQLDNIGFSFDWEREVRTSNPNFYKWTQWIFIKLFHSWYNNKSNKAEDIKTLIAEFEVNGNASVNAASDATETFSADEWKAMNEKQQQTVLLNYRNKLLHELVTALYSRTETELQRGNFRVKGDTVDIFLAYADFGYRILFFGDKIDAIEMIEISSGMRISDETEITIFPANIYVTSKDKMLGAIWEIQDDMVKQMEYLQSHGMNLEAKRLEDKVTEDLEMIRELGYCSGIENYSRYFDGRAAGTRPFCLMDYFPDDFLFVVDESHVTIGQIRAMYFGDRSRKTNLVEFGFRLPSAFDNRPLKFDEFETLTPQTIYVSATPAEYELNKSGGVIVEQVIRPTGLMDPVIEVRPSINQVDDLLEEIDKTVKSGARVLVTTLTKRMSEELAKYLAKLNIKCRYIHSDVETLERTEILRELRLGVIDVLIGINLLREGLDLPEVALVAILDADKEGFLRSARSLTQTAGRAARNLNGRVIMYADKITDSMRKTIDETTRRREKQAAYNIENNITPTQIISNKSSILGQTSVMDTVDHVNQGYIEKDDLLIANEPVIQYMNKEQLEKLIKTTKKNMEKAAKGLDFIEAAKYRDELFSLEKVLEEKESEDLSSFL